MGPLWPIAASHPKSRMGERPSPAVLPRKSGPELPELRRARVSLEIAEAREQVEQSAQGCGSCERRGEAAR